MLLDLILPSPCLLCEKIGKPICRSCLKGLALKSVPFHLADLPGFTFSQYSDQTSAIVNAVKEKGITAVIPDLAKEMSLTWPEESQKVTLVPIPSSPANRRKRGFSHTEVWARHLSFAIPDLKVKNILVSAKVRLDQAQLSPNERLLNMQEAFAVRPGLLDSPVVLFDDVLTTGATLTAARQALMDSGIAVAGFCVFTRVKPRFAQ